MAEQYTSIRVLHDRITKHPLLQNISMSDLLDYTVDFMRIVGVPNMFVDKVINTETDNYKIKLPCDYIYLNQIKGHHGMYRYSTDTFHLERKHQHEHTHTTATEVFVADNCTCSTCPHQTTCQQNHYNINGVECIALIHSTHTEVNPYKANTFTIQNNYIYLSNKHDCVDISYKALLMDEEGYPMIPDNSNFLRALNAYIKKEYFTILFDMQIITPQILQQAQQDYAWAVGSCETDMQKLDLSKAEVLLNTVKSMLDKSNEFATGFESNGDRIIMKTH